MHHQHYSITMGIFNKADKVLNTTRTRDKSQISIILVQEKETCDMSTATLMRNKSWGESFYPSAFIMCLMVVVFHSC